MVYFYNGGNTLTSWKSQEITKDGIAGLQNLFHNFKAKINKNVDIRQMDNLIP